jgi:hypothetical protein
MHRDVAAADLTMRRFSLDSDRQPLIPLEMELGMVSSYLDICVECNLLRHEMGQRSPAKLAISASHGES